MYGHEGMMWECVGWLGAIFWIFFIIFWIVFIIWSLGGRARRDRKASQTEESALDILKKRYAKGEINKDEFEQKKKDLIG